MSNMHGVVAKVYKISSNAKYGRHLVSAVDISPGQIILNEPAIVIGPSPSSISPVCPICYKRDPCLTFQCSDCRLSTCSETCSTNSSVHKLNECKILAEIGISMFNGSYKELYQFINAIRAVRLIELDDLKWKQIEQLQSNVQYLESIQSFEIFDKAVTKAGIDLTLARHCLGVLKTNSFSELSQSFAIEKLYFFSSFMAHSCLMNTERQFEPNSSNVHIICTKSIPVGHPITNTYVPYLNNNYERETELKKSWDFNCNCSRCMDPTENGTMLGALKCENCNQFTLCYSANIWKCINCGKHPVGEDFINRLESIQKSIPQEIEILDQWLLDQTFLHPNHSILTQIKYNLCQTIGTQNGIQNLGIDELLTKVSYCTQVLEILEKLYGDGSYLLIGLIYFQLWIGERELLDRKKSNIAGVGSHSSSSNLFSHAKKAYQILEPAIPGSNEFKMKIVLDECYNFSGGKTVNDWPSQASST